MADTVDMTAGTAASSVGGGSFRIANHVDLAAAQAKNVAAGNGALATDDVIQCIDIPAGTLVRNVYVTIDTASAATALTATVGDGGSAAGWDAEVDFEAAAGTTTYGAVGTDARALAHGYLYTSADTVDFVLTVDTVTSLGSVNVVAECFDPSYV
jgi:hypothetical protein